MKTKSKRKSGIGKKIRLGLLVAILVAAGGLWLVTWLKQPYTAVAFAVCGKAQGAVVTLRNGKQVFYKPEDPELFIVAGKIPNERKGTLRAAGPYCFQPPSQKVY